MHYHIRLYLLYNTWLKLLKKREKRERSKKFLSKKLLEEVYKLEREDLILNKFIGIIFNLVTLLEKEEEN